MGRIRRIYGGGLGGYHGEDWEDIQGRILKIYMGKIRRI